MNDKIAITDIRPILKGTRQIPTIMMWNRLECRPRTKNFDRALQAEVRDALWMLTRQWQMGEFKADDAGSPVLAKMHIRQPVDSMMTCHWRRRSNNGRFRF
jgi:hypothetical protein